MNGQIAFPTTTDEISVIRSVEVRRSPRRKRTVAARLESGTLIVQLPQAMSKAEEVRWVDKMRGRFEDAERKQSLNSTGQLERRAHHLNDEYFAGKLTWQSIEYVTNQKSRYGSCTSDDKTIRISDFVAALPDWVRDYVLMHELSHLMIPDHSQRFWKLVGRYPLTERARGFLIAKDLE